MTTRKKHPTPWTFDVDGLRAATADAERRGALNMKALIAAVLLSASVAYAATGFFTGNQETITTITGKMGIRCEYNAMGQTFWRTFRGFNCPMSVEVE